MNRQGVISGVLSLALVLMLSCGRDTKRSAENDRYCFTLDLKPDDQLIEQYKHIHTPDGAWPEIPKGIHDAGCLDMEIYLQENGMFLIVEIESGADLDSVWTTMGQQPRQEEWAEFVWQFQQSVPGVAEGDKWILMEKVFDLDDHL